MKEINLPLRILILFFIIAFSMQSCKKEESSEPKISDASASELPLLKGENRLGIIEGFNISNPMATQDSIAAKWTQAKSAGMTVSRIQLDWSELELGFDNYDQGRLRSELETFRNQGLQVFLLISAYDSDGPTIPEDLNELRFNDKVLIDRFKKLMDWVVPMLSENNGWAISISNEPDNSFGEIETLSDDLFEFVTAIREHIHTIDSKMAVTVTFAEGNLTMYRSEIQKIISKCDFTCFNFYGSELDAVNLTYISKSEAVIRSGVDELLALSPEKDLVIQELGMHTGLDSSAEIQRLFFEVFFSEMEQQSRIRAAFAFQLVDWSPETIDLYVTSFDDGSFPSQLLDAFSESLATIGLLRQNNGEARPAWDEYVKWLIHFQ